MDFPVLRINNGKDNAIRTTAPFNDGVVASEIRPFLPHSAAPFGTHAGFESRVLVVLVFLCTTDPLDNERMDKRGTRAIAADR